MKKSICSWGWAVVAAAFMVVLGACSDKDDKEYIVKPPVNQEPIQGQASSGIHVTVNAGFAEDGESRADVEETTVDGKTTRSLVFTEGDRICVSRYVIAASGDYYLTGYLDMVGAPSADGKSATFSGTLNAYDINNQPISNPDLSTIGDDPLAGTTQVCLRQADTPEGLVDESNHLGYYFQEAYSIAADVNTLMKTALYVEGSYDASSQSITFAQSKPILNCTLSGLTPGASYTVELRWAPDEEEYYSYNYFYEITSGITYAPKVTADQDGVAHFAISGSDRSLTTNWYWVLVLSNIDGSETAENPLGQKTLDAKVYNVTKESHISVFPYNQEGTEEYISNTFGLNASTWNQQNKLGLLKFRCMLCSKATAGIGYVERPAWTYSTLTIKDGDQIYTITAANGGTFNGNSNFYVAMLPGNYEFTFDVVREGKTYKRTLSDVHVVGGVADWIVGDDRGLMVTEQVDLYEQ